MKVEVKLTVGEITYGLSYVAKHITEERLKHLLEKLLREVAEADLGEAGR